MREKELLKSKTTWTGVAGIVTAVGGFFTGTIGAMEAIQMGLASLAAIFVRDAMRKER